MHGRVAEEVEGEVQRGTRSGASRQRRQVGEHRVGANGGAKGDDVLSQGHAWVGGGGVVLVGVRGRAMRAG